ncbi:cell wall-binding repeat-containing protein [Arthrobacter psychrolactophilus]|uniref:cell wall-binding repeat-containing protein n=1 Tax=Arthrobacter psychrolactophilus TaxID=92442 RepID=UPI0011B5A0BC|nr:cell wall-binding repeat-containing protein [Arthrobacter psychrolactophilus]
MNIAVRKVLRIFLAVVVAGLLGASGVVPAVAGPMQAAARPSSLTEIGPRLLIPGSAQEMVVSPDGLRGYILSYANDVAIQVLDLKTLALIVKIPLPSGSGGYQNRSGIAMAHDGALLYVAGDGANGILAIDTKTNAIASVFPIRNGVGVSHLAVSPNGRELIAVFNGTEINHYSLPSMTLRRSVLLSGDTGVQDLTFAPDSDTVLLTTARPDAVQPLDVETGTLGTAIPVCQYADSIVVTPNGEKAYVACSYGSLAVVDLVAGVASKTMGVGYRLTDAAISSDGTRLLVSSLGFGTSSVTEINTETDLAVTSIDVKELARHVAFNPATGQAYALSNLDRGTELNVIAVSKGTPATGIDRIYGADRYATAVDVSKSRFAAINTLYIATGEQFADALSAAPAASRERAPLLLTKSTVLPEVAREEIERLRPERIIVVGGVGAVSAEVFAQLKSMVPNTVRRSGIDRYATSRAIIEGAFGTAPFVYLATGEDYPDALSAGAVAAQNGTPVLLVRGSAAGVDAKTMTFLKQMKTRNAPIIGGTGAVSQGIENQLAAALMNPERSSGPDRFATNLAVNQRYTGGVRAYYAFGYDFPDALAISSVAAGANGMVYLVRSNCIPSATKRHIAGMKDVTRFTLIGGPAVVSNDVAFGKAC